MFWYHSDSFLEEQTKILTIIRKSCQINPCLKIDHCICYPSDQKKKNYIYIYKMFVQTVLGNSLFDE